MLRKIFCLSLLMGILCFIFIPYQANAIMITPLRLEFEVDPGDTVQDVIKFINEDSKELTVTVSTDNATAGDDEMGSPKFTGPDDPSGITDWIFIDKGEQIVKPRGQYAFPFVLKIPKNAEPGGHYGAICLYEVVPGSEEGVTSVNQEVCTLLIINVSGEVKVDAEVVEFSADTFYSSLPVEMLARIQNKGTVHIKPKGYIAIKDMFGRQVANLEFNSGEFNILPNSIRRISTTWQRRELPEDTGELKKEWLNFGFGPYKAELSFMYGTGDNVKLAVRYLSFWVLPWKLILIFLAGFIIALTAFIIFVKRYNKYIIKKSQRR